MTAKSWRSACLRPTYQSGNLLTCNGISKVTIAWAIHRLNGIVTPANAAYSAPELTHQIKSSGAKALFVGGPQLQIGLEAAKAAGIPKDKIWLMGMAGFEKADGFVTVEDLIAEGTKLSPLDALQWTKGQGERQPAFLSYSSGTSGLPKAVMVSHRNVIANGMQHVAFDIVSRKKAGISTQTVLGLLPLSHIYALVVIAHNCIYRGDEVVVLPKFELPTYLSAIERFKINHLFLVGLPRNCPSGCTLCRSADMIRSPGTANRDTHDQGTGRVQKVQS